jgi:glyoxylate reductase
MRFMSSRLSSRAASAVSKIGIMSSKPFVLFFNPVKHAKPVYETLQGVARTEVVSSTSRQEFFMDVEGKYKDIFAIYRTSSSGAVSVESSR